MAHVTTDGFICQSVAQVVFALSGDDGAGLGSGASKSIVASAGANGDDAASAIEHSVEDLAEMGLVEPMVLHIATTECDGADAATSSRADVIARVCLGLDSRFILGLLA